MRQIEHFIGGEFTAGSSGRRFEKRSPLDNRVITSIAEGGKAEVDAAVSALVQCAEAQFNATLRR